MKKITVKILPALIAVSLVSCQAPDKDNFQMTFRVDMSGAGVEDPASVGIRGDTPPLSWTENFPMEGPDANGIYKAVIQFDSLECGTRIQYKYFHGDSIWDNKDYAENGNRLAVYCCGGQVLPVDKWDRLEEFTLESRLTSASWDNLSVWVYIVGNGKKRGLSTEEIAREIADFWGWDPTGDDTLDGNLKWVEFDQAKSPYGYFEIITNTPGKVEYIQSRYWETALYYWNEDGVVQGVAADDLSELFSHLRNNYAERNGWVCSWQDLGDHREKVTITK